MTVVLITGAARVVNFRHTGELAHVIGSWLDSVEIVDDPDDPDEPGVAIVCRSPYLSQLEKCPLSDAAGLRPVRLHDLRHGQASLMLAAGVPMAIVSKRLGHSSISITSDTYSHLLEGVGQQAASAAAALVPRRDRRTQNEPKLHTEGTKADADAGIAAVQEVGRLGIEPRTRGLKVRCSAS